MTEVLRKILVADDEEGIRDVFCMIIESNFDYEILNCDCAASAISTIKRHGGVDLIFSDYDMGVDNGGELYQYILDNNLNTPFALCSTYSPEEIKEFETFFTDHPENAYFQKPFASEQIVSYIKKIFINDEAPVDKNNFIKLSPERFMRLNQSKKTFDVYIKLSQKKYIKIINEGEGETFEVIDKYIKKGIDYIYLQRESYLDFEQNSIESLFDKYEEIKKTGTSEEKFETILDSIASLQDYVKNLGVNERTVELIEKVVDSTQDMISQKTKLDDLLKMLDSRNGYIKDQAYLTSYLACSIAESMSWKTEGIWKKIITASLFQNLSLEIEEEAKIFDLEKEEFKNLDDLAKRRVKLHPQDSVKMLEAAGEFFSEDTRKMIQNHHELPDGSGYPRGLDSSKISPLEALFILSTNFAHNLMISKNAEEISIVAQDYNEFFNKGNFKKPFQGFLKAFTKLICPID